MRVASAHVNAVWASQRQTSTNELLGSSSGQPFQVFFTRDTPVLPGETIEVRELQGARANVEYELLRREVLGAGLRESDMRVVRDQRTGRVTEVWVTWQSRRTLLFSGDTDRHYAVERTRGRVLFGDDVHGRIPAAGTDNVRIARYTAGGGAQGNVPASAIAQILSGVAAQKVSNARAAEGGADGEDAAEVLFRGPRTVRHRRQAISQADYEALAREASPAVAVVRAQPTTDAAGRRRPGAVTLFIVPQSRDAQPMPALSLLRDVRDFLYARTPVGARDGIVVRPPRYLLVGVEATVAPRAGLAAGAVREAVLAALARFFHPLTGGPGGGGWPFGRDVFLSDVAAMLERQDGVDYVQTLVFLADGTARGDTIAVPSDRIVAAGTLRVTLAAPER
jgi:predicted phage baseplate assembly protein